MKQTYKQINRYVTDILHQLSALQQLCASCKRYYFVAAYRCQTARWDVLLSKFSSQLLLL